MLTMSETSNVELESSLEAPGRTVTYLSGQGLRIRFLERPLRTNTSSGLYHVILSSKGARMMADDVPQYGTQGVHRGGKNLMFGLFHPPGSDDWCIAAVPLARIIHANLETAGSNLVVNLSEYSGLALAGEAGSLAEAAL